MLTENQLNDCSVKCLLINQGVIMNSELIKYRNEKYRCHAPVKDIETWVHSFDLRRVYQVVMVHKDTGNLRFDMHLCAFSRDDAMMYFSGHFHRNYDVLDAWPVLELIEDRECLERRLKYQLSIRHKCKDAKRWPHYYKSLRSKPRETIKKLRALAQ